ncbi:variable surface lipoprotein [Mycoplasmopsis felifaucium]|uniref:variable surface lipoprotein n=1 Tax=Mycoplasmopsis felifaucium TaxID=35768 RepID=UPI000482A010|nr:variable surface lipoprotein [Mycoplasmopsis felifaucium]
MKFKKLFLGSVGGALTLAPIALAVSCGQTWAKKQYSITVVEGSKQQGEVKQGSGFNYGPYDASNLKLSLTSLNKAFKDADFNTKQGKQLFYSGMDKKLYGKSSKLPWEGIHFGDLNLSDENWQLVTEGTPLYTSKSSGKTNFSGYIDVLEFKPGNTITLKFRLGNFRGKTVTEDAYTMTFSLK